MTTFDYDGERFEFANDPDEWTLDELLDMKTWIGGDLTAETDRMLAAKVFLAISIRRRRPEFTFTDAGRIPVKVLRTMGAPGATKAGDLVREPGNGGDDDAPVLSPGSAAGPEGTPAATPRARKRSATRSRATGK